MKAGGVTSKALLALALLVSAGCVQESRNQENDWIVVSPRSPQMAATGSTAMYRDVQFADIPIPAGYNILAQESYSFQGALFRNGILKYQGPVEWDSALLFFRTQLPIRGWVPQRMEKGSGSRILYFRKEQEKLIVIVMPVPGGSRAELQLDNVDKNDLLLKGKLADPGYGQTPTYSF